MLFDGHFLSVFIPKKDISQAIAHNRPVEGEYLLWQPMDSHGLSM